VGETFWLQPIGVGAVGFVEIEETTLSDRLLDALYKIHIIIEIVNGIQP
jgi:hypothetical protein